MTRPARLRRFLVRSLLVLALLAGGAWVAARLFLTSAAARRLVASDLGERLRTSVTLDALEPAFLGKSVVRGLKLLDADGHPYLEADRAEVNLSLWKVVARGARLPGYLDVRGAALRLRFGRDGSLLTKLPTFPETGRMPLVKVHGLTVVLEQEGRAPFSLTGGSLVMRADRPDNLRGILDDPVWGTFDIIGDYRKGTLQLSLASPGVALTAGMFRALPFVPASLHRQLEFEGERVPLRLRLAFGPLAPYARYAVTFRDAQVRLLQPDRPALVAAGASGTLDGSEEGFVLKGALDDPYWGQWSAASGYVARTGAISVQLDTPESPVDQEKLTALPYVSASVWRSVQASGRTPATVLVALSVEKPEVRYRVELAPRGAKVRVAALDLEAEDASGRVTVEDHRVSLRGVRGRSASGSIATEADLDFRTDPTRMRFDLDVRGLELGQLPAKWELPRQIEGKVTGKARLDVTVRDGRTETRGSGSGRIDDATLAGFRAGEPIPLDLFADGKTIRFRPRSLLQSLMSVAPAAAPQGPSGRGEVP
jgi:hypothetical protein